MTYDDAVKLFRKGHFLELINGFKESGRWQTSTRIHVSCLRMSLLSAAKRVSRLQ